MFIFLHIYYEPKEKV